MAEIIERDTYASAIHRIHAFAVADTFPASLNRAIRTRLNHLHDQWSNLRAAHIKVLHALENENQRGPHLDAYLAAENEFLAADAIMQERLAEVDNAVEELSVHDARSEDGNDDNRQEDGRHDDNGNDNQQDPPLADEQRPIPPVGQYQVAAQLNGLPWQFRIENIWGEFAGDKKEWPAFHDSFNTTIYEHPTMPPVQKLQILRAALKGKAAKSIGQWQVRGCNFEPVWQRLKELYDDPYTTSKELFQKVAALRKIDQPNGNRLQIMSNVAQEVSRTLGALGYPTRHYDLFLIHSIQEKLDEKTSVAWNLQRQSDRPSLAEFTKFLDRQAKALANAYYSEMAQKPRDQNNRKRPFSSQSNGSAKHSGGNGSGHWQNHANAKGYHGDSKRFKAATPQSNYAAVKMENSKCAVCFEAHLTRKCPRFLQMNLHQRKDKARAANLCFNCLAPGHSLRDCKSGKCNRCDKKHNSLLCTENPNNRQLNVSQAMAKNAKKTGKGNKSRQQ